MTTKEYVLYMLFGAVTAAVFGFIVGWASGTLWIGFLLVSVCGVVGFFFGDLITVRLGKPQRPKGRHRA